MYVYIIMSSFKCIVVIITFNTFFVSNNVMSCMGHRVDCILMRHFQMYSCTMSLFIKCIRNIYSMYVFTVCMYLQYVCIAIESIAGVLFFATFIVNTSLKHGQMC